MTKTRFSSLSQGAIALSLFFTVLCSSHAALAQAMAPDSLRIVSIGGSVTEILYALGLQDQIVAVDDTSTFPPQALKEKPSIGYIRRLNAEGVLAVEPGMIISEAGAGPVEAVDSLKAAGIPIIFIPTLYSPEGIVEKIEAVGAAVKAEKAAEKLAANVKADLDLTAHVISRIPEKERKKVLFLFSVRDGRLMVGGKNSHAAAIIKMAGGTNLMQSIEGYKMVDDEALLSNPPDVILMMKSHGDAISNEDLAALPALAHSPAIKNNRIIRMDGMYLLGFGPRTAQAVKDLAKQLYPDSEAIRNLSLGERQ
ncbi:iron complex transport system substrate-binding protein [Cohaesibacter marisflavi]|uniref:Iron complex transport system substrate-binding protein n=1 Tax=Cohaesibacter marisflavi TaxID=655353 RepID=A0A1I5LYK3_9HYPH|nr:ABC transporter substrate-binding protein [Cohaesibacter marisflavi]SFP02409.1 iron complex transport system substrate-binding protein [Cohaesibacter marisflavi]